MTEIITEIITTGDIIQITDTSNKWYPCLLIVSELKSWGVQAYITIPSNDGQPSDKAYYRIENGKFKKVGKANIYEKG